MKSSKSDIFAVVEESGECRTTIEDLGKTIIIAEWEGDSEVEGVVISRDRVRNLTYCLTLLANSIDGGLYDPDDCKRCLVNK